MPNHIAQYIVEVTEGAPTERRNGSMKTPEGTIDYDFNIQKVFIHVGDAFPHPFNLRLETGQAPYPAGKYLLVDFLQLRGGKAEVVKTPKLVPAKPAQ